MTKYPEQWKVERNALTRTFTFDTFLQAVAFVNKVAALAEDMNHHPDFKLFSYNKVKVTLTTHDAGNTITKKDIEMAEKIGQLV